MKTQIWRQILIVATVALTAAASGCATVRSRGEVTTVTVRKDDTLNKIAKTWDSDWRVIASMNRDKLANGLREGQELIVRVGPKASGQPEDDSLAADDQGDDEDMGFVPKRKKGLLYGPSSKEPPQLIYPVEGGISSHFGKRGRRHHKGIDIVANVGTPIVAAGDGEVIFAGRQRGYGSTIVIDHGQFMTLYAHASKLIAQSGNKVRQGEFIAKVGRTGNARGAHLHFELRDSGNKPIDPGPYLRHKTIARAKTPSAANIASERVKSPRKASTHAHKRDHRRRGLLYAKD
jgi:murein DD-endopeptidase MepM/ murein hydrolase activator NlpD